MSIVRMAEGSDFLAVMGMGVKFIMQNGAYDVFGHKPESVEKTILNLMGSPMGALFVLDKAGALVGMAGGLLFPCYYNEDHLTGQELFWWVEPEHRSGRDALRLMSALEGWAKEQGARSFTMVRLDAMGGEPLDRLYRRKGYAPLEHSYLRRL